MAQITPVWLLGHLSGALSGPADAVAAGMFVAVFAVFAARKTSQAVKDDIGDGSVFLCAPRTIQYWRRILKQLGISVGRWRCICWVSRYLFNNYSSSKFSASTVYSLTA